MTFETEHYKLAIRPLWIIKGNPKKLACCGCEGSGIVHTALGCTPEECKHCRGTGESPRYNIGPPPLMDDKFLNDLQEWFNNYKGIDNSNE